MGLQEDHMGHRGPQVDKFQMGLVAKTGHQESLGWALKCLDGASGDSDRALRG